MAMAGRQPEQGEGSTRDAQGSFGSGLDHFLRRLDSANDAAEPVGATSQQQASASNSIAALVSNYDALSPNPVNPWQYLSPSNPASPTAQREYYNHLSAHTSSGGQFQRDLAYEWNMLEELEQQRAISQGQSAMTSRAPSMNHQNLRPPAPVPLRDAENCVEHSEAANFMYEEAAAAAAWYRNGGYLRGPDAASQALYESLARLDTQTSDSTQLGDEARVRSWERAMASQFFETVQDPPWPSRAPPSPEAAPGGSTRSANSIRTPSNTSQSSGSDGDDSDEEECTRIGNGNMSSGKRKTPEPSGEDGNDSTRTSSHEAELKKTAASMLRRRSSYKKPREPRYAIKTRTDVDIMDDGFKWRKYGQKAVKNSPHPRNYYRCTTPQCPVRKRVERSHEDSGLVITTYEGTHTHQAPGFRGPVPQPPRNVCFNPGPGGFAPAHFPFPPEFSLAALQQLRALQQVARMAAQHQMPRRPPFSTAQRESIRRAQQFLGLHDPAFGAAKQEPFYDFMAQLRGAPFPAGRNFQPPSCGATLLDRMRQYQMRGPPPRQPPDLDYPDVPPPPTDTDLVRRVLEAEDHGPGNTDASADLNDGSAPGQTFASQIQSSLRSRVELERRMSQQRSDPGLMRRRDSSDNLGSTSSQRAWQPQHHGSDDDSLVDGLLQEMAQPNARRKSSQ